MCSGCSQHSHNSDADGRKKRGKQRKLNGQKYWINKRVLIALSFVKKGVLAQGDSGIIESQYLPLGKYTEC